MSFSFSLGAARVCNLPEQELDLPQSDRRGQRLHREPLPRQQEQGRQPRRDTWRPGTIFINPLSILITSLQYMNAVQ